MQPEMYEMNFGPPPDGYFLCMNCLWQDEELSMLDCCKRCGSSDIVSFWYPTRNDPMKPPIWIEIRITVNNG